MDTNIENFIDDIRAKGIEMHVEGEKLRVTPKKLLTREQTDFIAANKDAVMALLLNAQAEPPPDVPTDNGNEPSPLNPPESPQSGLIAGAAIRLGVVSKQLDVFNDSIESICDALVTNDGTALDRATDALDALSLTQNLVNELCREFGDAAEKQGGN